MEFWHEPVPLPALEKNLRPAVKPTKRSRESLELEATAYGMPAQLAARLSRDELQEWLGTYLSFRNITKGVISRKLQAQTQAQNLPVTNFKRRKELDFSTMTDYQSAQYWADNEPDYFDENYVGTSLYWRSMGETFERFTVPENAPYRDKPLRILLVNDDAWIYRRMLEGLEDPTVTIRWVSGPEEAKELLANDPESIDIILLDLALRDYRNTSMLEVPMYVYNHELDMPVISNSSESSNHSWLLSYNIVGEYPPVLNDYDMPELIAYLKNIANTGRARPVSDSFALFSERRDEHARSRNDQLLLLYGEEGRQQLGEWANSQPDFYEDNYLISTRHLTYDEPFHPDVKSMRVLLVSDDIDVMVSLSDAAKLRGNVTIDIVHSVREVENRLKENKYDIIATDFVLQGDNTGYEVGMYVWKNWLDIPVVAVSKSEIGPRRGLLHNLVGQALYPSDVELGDAALRYFSHIVATGRAFD